MDSLLARPVLEDLEAGRPFSASDDCLLDATGKTPSDVLVRVRGARRFVDELEGVKECVLLSSLEPIEAWLERSGVRALFASRSSCCGSRDRRFSALLVS